MSGIGPEREAEIFAREAQVLARAIADEQEARTPHGRREAGRRAINDAIHSQHARHERRSAAGLERLFGWKPRGE